MNTSTVTANFMDAIHRQLPPPGEWTPLATYPNSLAEAVIDSLWSERVRYSTIAQIIDRYRAFRAGQGGQGDTDSARALLESFDIGLDAWMEQIGNHQRAYSRTDAPYKADLVHQAAMACVRTGVETAAQLRTGAADYSSQVAALKERWLALPSQHSGLTWERLLLVAGLEHVSPDGWLEDFMNQAVGQPLESGGYVKLIDHAAANLGTTPLRLRNAIWHYQTEADATRMTNHSKSCQLGAPPR